jgi:hypothetical protein
MANFSGGPARPSGPGLNFLLALLLTCSHHYTSLLCIVVYCMMYCIVLYDGYSIVYDAIYRNACTCIWMTTVLTTRLS